MYDIKPTEQYATPYYTWTDSLGNPRTGVEPENRKVLRLGMQTAQSDKVFYQYKMLLEAFDRAWK